MRRARSTSASLERCVDHAVGDVEDGVVDRCGSSGGFADRCQDRDQEPFIWLPGRGASYPVSDKTALEESPCPTIRLNLSTVKARGRSRPRPSCPTVGSAKRSNAV